MSSVHRILTGLEFFLDPTAGLLNWPAETEDLVRLSIELARVTRSGLAFAAVAAPPEENCDCGQTDSWVSAAEQQVDELWRTASTGEFPIERAAWFGNPAEEWVESSRDSEIDLLIVSGSAASTASSALRAELRWPDRAECPVWFAGREPDRLSSDPPLIVFCDDLSDEAAVHLPFAVDLALAWNARFLVIHPVTLPVTDLSPDETDRLRREVFIRLSRTDFRAIPHGSQLRFVTGGVEEILAEVRSEQTPNLILASAGLVKKVRPLWSGHLLLWGHRSSLTTPEKDG